MWRQLWKTSTQTRGHSEMRARVGSYLTKQCHLFWHIQEGQCSNKDATYIKLTCTRIRGLCEEGKGTLCMKWEICLRTNKKTLFYSGRKRFWTLNFQLKSDNLQNCFYNSLFDGQSVWTWDGISVEEGQEVTESIKKGPVREQADAFVGVDSHWSVRPEPVCLQAQLRSLFVSQMFLWIGLIELDGGTVNLRAQVGLHFREQKSCLDTCMMLLHF